MMDVRSLLKLTIGGGCVLGSTVFPPLLAGEGIAWGVVLATTLASVAAGNTANAIDALTEGKDGDRVSLENEHLTRAVGKAIAAVITLAAQQHRGESRKNLEKIAAQAKDNWLRLAQQELTQVRYPQLREATLDQFLTPEEYQLTQEGNLTVPEWRTIFVKLDVMADPDGRFEIADPVKQEVAELLSATFPKALRETLKEDFHSDGKAFAGLTLQLLTGMKAELAQLQANPRGVNPEELAQILEQFQDLATQLRGNITQQQEFFRDVSCSIESGFAQVCQRLGVMETTITGLLQTLEERIEDLHQEVTEFRQEVRQGLAAMQYPSEERSLSTDEWQDMCRQMLERKTQLTSNTVLGQVYGNRNLIDEDLFVDLALVKPKRSQNEKYGQDIDPARGSDLFARQEETVEKRFAYREFLDEIIGKRTEKQIAIIGEPGAGKTTLLQKLAFWLLQQTDDLVIWVDLAELGIQPLGEYLEEKWLKEALGQSREEIRADWEQKFKGGAVWLLLDGLDEMSQTDQQALKFRGWVTDARIIVTCRLNLWQANPSQLQGFQTYLTQPFQDEQVQEFIRRWFPGLVESGEAVQLAESLWSELQAAGKERIKDLCRNPLRLTLLCSTWKVEDALPETMAELYAGFVEAMYAWKKKAFTVEKEEKKHLNAALGALAKASLEAETSRFRLTHRLVCEYFGELDEDSLVLRLGWLNEVGVAAENPREKVYAFYHATFQEYFAALAVEDWDYFLPKDHGDRPVEGKRYRIFEPQWKQVILLWLGRWDILDEQKKAFIEKLVNFNDGCGEWKFADINIGFYEYHAYCLAATGMTEFKDFKNSSLAGTMVEQIVKWAFGYFNEKTKQWQNYIDPLRRHSKYITLLELDPNQVFNCMRDLIDKNPGATWIFVENGYGYILKQIARIHRKNKVVEDISNDVLQILWRQAETPECEKEILDIVRCLVDLDPSNVNLTETVLDVIEKSYNGKKGQEAAEMLDKFSFSNHKDKVIEGLHHIVQKSESIYGRICAAYGLFIVDPMNLTSKSKELLNDIIYGIEQEKISLEKSLNYTRLNIWIYIESKKQAVTFAAYILGKVDPGNPKAISVLENRARLKDQVLARAYLGCIDPGNDLSLHLKKENSPQDDEQVLYSDLQEKNDLLSETIPVLVELLQTTDSRMIQHDASRCLRNHLTTNILREEAVSVLKAFPDVPINENQYAVFNDDSYYDLSCVQRYELFWNCAENLPYPDFYRAWHHPPTTPHPEVTEQTPHSSAQSFASPFTCESLQHLPIYCLKADILADETDTSEIASTLCQLIWDEAFPNEDYPKKVTKPSKLREHLKQLKLRQNLPKLAILITDCPPRDELIAFCRKLTNIVAIAWLTDAPLEAPLKGFPPNQIQLISAIEAWLEEM
ncbi:NACHT domain-containing protein [Roseofilum reptotaenium]